jgi:hypothetical protein
VTTVDTTAIRDAMPILEAVVLARLATITPATLAGGAHWRQNPGDQPRKLPYVIVQPQTPGVPVPFVGSASGWQGLLVIRVYGHTQALADAAAAACAGALIGTHTHAGYTGWDVTIQLDRPLLLPIPIGQSAQVAGHQFVVRIHRR